MRTLVIYRPCQTALQKALQIYIPIIKQCILHLCQTWILSTVQVLFIRLEKKCFWLISLITDFAELVQHPSIHLLVICISSTQLHINVTLFLFIGLHSSICRSFYVLWIQCFLFCVVNIFSKSMKQRLLVVS